MLTEEWGSTNAFPLPFRRTLPSGRTYSQLYAHNKYIYTNISKFSSEPRQNVCIYREVHIQY